MQSVEKKKGLYEDQQGNTAPGESKIIKMFYLNNKEEFTFLSAASLGFRLILSGQIFRILLHHSLSAHQCQQLHIDSQSISKIGFMLLLCRFFCKLFVLFTVVDSKYP